jgi:nucleotide-binding universal stress UspA family protein
LACPVADALHEQAVALGADWIVLTTHGRGLLARFWLGSVADQLVRRTTVPIFLVRPRDDAPDLNREQVITNILVPLDGSSLAEQVLEPAASVARAMGAQVTLLRVVQPLVLGNYDPGELVAVGLRPAVLHQLEQIQAELVKAAEGYLDGVAGRLRARGLTVRTAVVASEQPAVAILDEVRARGCDLIALATHGRSGLARMFLGSVADKVIRGATVSVLIHHPTAN